MMTEDDGYWPARRGLMEFPGDEEQEMAPDRILTEVSAAPEAAAPSSAPPDPAPRATSLSAALITQYVSLGLVVVVSVLFVVAIVIAARLARDVKRLPLLGVFSKTRLLLCALATLYSMAHIIRIPLSTFAYGLGEPLENVVSGLVLSFGRMKIPPSTETLLCRVYLTLTVASSFPLFLIIVR